MAAPDQTVAPRVISSAKQLLLEKWKKGEQQKRQTIPIRTALGPFDLTRLPLLRVTLLQLAESEYVMLGIVHHIVFDGWSVGVFQSEFFECYRAFTANRQARLPKLPIQYPDYAEWQRTWLEGERLQRQLDYWKTQMSGERPVLQLPADKTRPLVSSFRGSSLPFSFGEDLAKPMHRLSDETGVTSFMLVLAAFNVWQHRYYGQEDILVGCPIANRNYPELEGLIGNFANTLVLRTDLSGNRSEEHTSELQSHSDLVCRLLLEKKKKKNRTHST